jgi:hypothetical protein
MAFWGDGDHVLVITDETLKKVEFVNGRSQGARVFYHRNRQTNRYEEVADRSPPVRSVKLTQADKVVQVVFEGWNPKKEGLTVEQEARLRNFLTRQGSQVGRVDKVVLVAGMRSLRGNLERPGTPRVRVRKIRGSAKGVIKVMNALRSLFSRGNLFYMGPGKLLEDDLTLAQMGPRRSLLAVRQVNRGAEELVEDVASYFRALAGFAPQWFGRVGSTRIRVVVKDAFLGLCERESFSRSGNHLSDHGALFVAHLVRSHLLEDDDRYVGLLAPDRSRERYRGWFRELNPGVQFDHLMGQQFVGGYGWAPPGPAGDASVLRAMWGAASPSFGGRRAADLLAAAHEGSPQQGEESGSEPELPELVDLGEEVSGIAPELPLPDLADF